MRLPPSSTAWRMAAPRRSSAGGCAARAASSTPSMRPRQASRRAAGVPPVASGIVAEGRERRAGLGLLGVGEQAHAQLGRFQGLLAAPVEAHATLVGGEGILETHVAALHLPDQLLEGVEGSFEVGD